MNRLALVFPGIGYTADKPLLYYSIRLAARLGYQTRILSYSGFPDGVFHDEEKMRMAFSSACAQAASQVSDLDFSTYDDILLIGKSIGTVVAAQLASGWSSSAPIRMVLFTPLAETFLYPLSDAIVFTGTADPWVKGHDSIHSLCTQREIPCFVTENGNHSLETGDVSADLQTLSFVMRNTERFMVGQKLFS